MSEEEDETSEFENHFIAKIHRQLTNPGNDSEDFSKPYLRPIFMKSYPLVIFIYSLLIISGIIGNFSMAYHIFKFKLYKDPTHAYLINMIISDIIKCIFVLPISLAVILIDNWIFGKFLCYFLPMLQDAPFHTSMMTYLLIAFDRFKVISEPGKPRIPAFVFALGSWFFAACIVLPYPIYSTYMDLEALFENKFKGLEICFVNLLDDIQEYMRGLFIGTYVVPLAITSYIYIKANKKLQIAKESMGIDMSEGCSRDETNVENTQNNRRENIVRRDSLGLPIDLDEVELDIPKETRSQKYLIFMVSVFAVCLCPLMILRLARLVLSETYENSKYFDITYILFVWIAFLPTVTTPALYAFWQMSRTNQENLRKYFQCSNCRQSQVDDNGISEREIQGNIATVDQARLCQIGNISRSNSDTESQKASPRRNFKGNNKYRGNSASTESGSFSNYSNRR